MLAPINAQLPWQLTGFILLWTLAAVAHWKMRACHCNAIVDEGDQWLVEFQNRSDRVRYQQTDYCSAYLIVIQFRTRTGKPRRVCVWRDAVSPAAFSWLAARIRLTSPDRKVKIMATSQLSALNSTQQRALH